MVQDYESIFYYTLNELQETYKPGHPDVMKLKNKYGDNVKFSRIMHREGTYPRFELCCYEIIWEG